MKTLDEMINSIKSDPAHAAHIAELRREMVQTLDAQAHAERDLISAS